MKETFQQNLPKTTPIEAFNLAAQVSNVESSINNMATQQFERLVV